MSVCNLIYSSIVCFYYGRVCPAENPSPYPHVSLWARSEGDLDQEGVA